MNNFKFLPSRRVACLLFVLLLLCAQLSLALQPEEILLIVNRKVPVGIELARYYQQQRQVPVGNLLEIELAEQEDVSHEDYLRQVVAPLRDYLAAHDGAKIRCLLLFYGLPLRVAAPLQTPELRQHLEEYQRKKGLLDEKITTQADAAEVAQWRSESEQLGKRIAVLKGREQGAALDSEIALALNDNYPLDMWLANPYFLGYRDQPARQGFSKAQVLFVARLDAPTPEIVRRVIDDSLFAERQGLQGRGYFDARWPLPNTENLHGYALYDASIHKAAAATQRLSRLPVKLDQQERLFQAGEAPQAALYCGWYSLANYVAAFSWQPGAVGFHIASGECTTLKQANSQVWCKRMLEEGVAATIGPVAEPYVQGFPLPELFFSRLLDGYYTLAESYFLSLPFLSWQMVLIGDPLYRPFLHHQ